jgi:hypothetical protein
MAVQVKPRITPDTPGRLRLVSAIEAENVAVSLYVDPVLTVLSLCT